MTADGAHRAPLQSFCDKTFTQNVHYDDDCGVEGQYCPSSRNLEIGRTRDWTSPGSIYRIVQFQDLP